MTRERQRKVMVIAGVLALFAPHVLLVTGCSSAPEAVAVTDAAALPPSSPAATAPINTASGPQAPLPAANDAATRRNPVVVGRPSRVFIMAGVGPDCRPLGDPQISIIQEPQKGSVSLKPGQLTSIEASAQGTCIGQKAMGTGIYYTARPGQTGRDAFTIEARLATGEMARRAFDIEITE